jgi:hypothetical protein
MGNQSAECGDWEIRTRSRNDGPSFSITALAYAASAAHSLFAVWWFCSTRCGSSVPLVNPTASFFKALCRFTRVFRSSHLLCDATSSRSYVSQLRLGQRKVSVEYIAMYWTMYGQTVRVFGLNSQGRGNAPFWYEYRQTVAVVRDLVKRATRTFRERPRRPERLVRATRKPRFRSSSWR